LTGDPPLSSLLPSPISGRGWRRGRRRAGEEVGKGERKKIATISPPIKEEEQRDTLQNELKLMRMESL